MLLPTLDDRPAAPCALPGTPLAAARPGLDACVHCGFCLQACPTYVNLQDENDSPRGRIQLMREVLEGGLPVDDPDVNLHIDRCLGCRACETACPSGVPYGQLLEATRATLAEGRPRPLVARVVLGTFARKRLLALVLLGARLFRATGLPRLLARALGGRAAFALAMLDSTRPAVRAPHWRPRGDGARGEAVLLEGCVMRGLFAHTHDAARRTLGHNGYRMVRAPGQACCGALHAHAGDLETARALARANVAAFERAPDALVVSDAAGCGAMLKVYGQLLADDTARAARARAEAARASDVSEALAAVGARAAAGAAMGDGAPVRVTYDAPCHLLHAQRVADPPLRVLEAVGGIELVPLAEADQCCGSAGIYNLIEPETSDAVLAPKLQHVRDTGAALVASGNPGCLMQLGAGLSRAGSRTRVVHPVELLDAAYARGDSSV
ncbi:heterodisulfide reductase-related iron-sulfur binding cluster [Roseisolibacter sp. H3M3-2]|uniref:(Fe-S)-binding protein n=1 Tax=Roseisolibacter sp. H3M3-2 TaxID=3031323 RepID=UPI0023DB4525|nr:heterodisulfide reductase-related iron-sulfur binding cluster [Roseisolibacter sp. H3M3-2]MDF1505734.1 heterodisulfide reductase-related iron-sulfur binding cluster [Roseisolibacter sp. H3M3-2]